eukprot:gene32473-36661_t
MKPLRADNPIYAEIKSLAVRMEAWFNAGDSRHGRIGWFLMMFALVAPTMLIYWVLIRFDWFLAAFAWNVLIVYLTLGFRHYSHYFTSIQLALNAGDEAAARALLAEWTKIDTVGVGVGDPTLDGTRAEHPVGRAEDQPVAPGVAQADLAIVDQVLLAGHLGDVDDDLSTRLAPALLQLPRRQRLDPVALVGSQPELGEVDEVGVAHPRRVVDEAPHAAVDLR